MRFFMHTLPFVLSLLVSAQLLEARQSERAHEQRSPLPSPSTVPRFSVATTSLDHQWHKRSNLLCGLFGLFCDYSSDVNNCGSAGKVCPSSGWTYGNGTAVCVNSLCGTGCVSGYAFSWSLMKCISITNDVNNCGAIGTLCSASSAAVNAKTLACVASACQATTCNTGYYVANGLCAINIDTTSDVNNCGVLKNVCPTSYANGLGSVCLNSVCQPTSCNVGYAFDYSAKKCTYVLTDTNNCGSVGKICSFPYGSGSCIAGSCILGSCNTNYYNINGVCTYMNLQSDANNCGSVGKTCSFPNGVGSCVLGSCQFSSCSSGYALANNSCAAINYQTDMNNCGSTGKICQSSYLNGGAGSCVNGKCTTTCNSGYTWDATYKICRLTSSDINNCGGIGVVCNPLGSLSSICSNSQCYASACLSGYQLTSGTCYKIDTTSNVNNCGAIGAPCTFIPVGATGVCANSKCVITVCPAKYTLSSSGVCVASAVSQRPRVAKREKVKRTPCPKGETPCPIKASASFELAVTQHFTAPNDEYSGVFAGLGGYECLDTRESLESCGGCSSTGEGQDCTSIKGALGVGCDSGKCVIFSCKEGWKRNVRGTKCVRSKTESERNATRQAIKKRKTVPAAHGHVHARGHLHQRGHSSSL